MNGLLRAARIVTPDRVLDDGWLLVEDDVVVARGSGAAPEPTRRSTRVHDIEGTVVPGFVDLHAHGALGHDLATCSAADARAVAAHHAARGTTSLVASIATGAPEATTAALRRLAPLVTEGVLAGLHLEGPWLSPARRGAHAPDLLHAPTTTELDAYLDAAAGALRIVTLAPELPGALDAVARLADAGVVVAVGHTDADAATVERTVDAGARLVTHVFNGMPPLHHRSPGPVGIALTDPRLTVEAIVDGHHLDAITVDLVRRSAAGRMVLVSDAMAATGCPDGAYRIAGSDVVVADGVAMLADGSSLAGSTGTVADGFTRLLEAGASFPEAVEASSGRAAALLGLPVPLAIGSRADLFVVGAGPLPEEVLA